jgi:hypothetical protein
MILWQHSLHGREGAHKLISELHLPMQGTLGRLEIVGNSFVRPHARSTRIERHYYL